MNSRKPFTLSICLALAIVFFFGYPAQAGPPPSSSSAKPEPPPASPPATKAQIETWSDNFEGTSLNPKMWEAFTFEGGTGGKIKVENGQLRMRGMGASRSGVRTVPAFISDHFVVEATLAKVGPAMPDPGGAGGVPIGNAIVTLLFDTSGRNRLEWILTTEGTFEAWSIVDGRGERLDNRKLGTKISQPALGIGRRGDDFFFLLNGQPGLQKSIHNVPRSFHVMLYGFGSSENNWKSVTIQTLKQP